ncbi:hypothetical protein N7522_001785 [Penicillium canescens]|nr:hypothetical protein N7522_001785 [Penicillium canescens]
MSLRDVKCISRFCLPTISSTQCIRRKPLNALFRAYNCRNESLISSLPKGSRTGVGKLLDDYDRLLTSRSGIREWAYSPSFDIRETDDAYHLEGELPGVQPSDIDVEFEDSHRVNVKGHNSRESCSNDPSWWVCERSVGEFRRTFNFPIAIDQENTRAQLKDGVLSITIPKSGSGPISKKVHIDT